MNPRVRLAQPGDRATLLSLTTVFATSFQIEANAFSRTFERLLDDPNAYLAVAEREREIVGYILAFTHPTLYANGEVAWVEEVMVEATARRQGVGRAMMQSVEKWAQERGCKLIALATRRAADFYRAIEYEESATYFRKLL